MTKVNTIQLQGKDYAQVKDRLNEFRKDNPFGLIETTPTIQPDGQILFKARIVKDKSNDNSAEATGHAMGKAGAQKAFEKLETIAVGRALALLGYASDGEIASGEEMEEFIAHKQEVRDTEIANLKEAMEESKNLIELKEIWSNIKGEYREELEDVKNAVKQKHESN